MANFVYLLVDEESLEAVVVDSGWETEPIVRAATEMGAKVRYAIATHEHFDHTTTLRELSDRLGAKVVAHEDSPIERDVRVADQQRPKLGRASLKVLHTHPGACRTASASMTAGTSSPETLCLSTRSEDSKELTASRSSGAYIRSWSSPVRLSCIRVMTTGTFHRERFGRKVRRTRS